MLPPELKAEHFAQYPPLARALAVKHLEVLQQLPLAFLPLLLREVIGYDWKFPAERSDIDHQLAYLSAMKPEALLRVMAPFAGLRVSAQLQQVDWVNRPAIFSEQWSAELWATRQIDAFRAASVDYVHQLNAARNSEPLPVPRLAIAIIGSGVSTTKQPLFRKLRPHGTYYRNVSAIGGRETLLQAVSSRAKAHPARFAHWYIDGQSVAAIPDVACISYQQMHAVRIALVSKMRAVMQPGGGGPEMLRTMLAQTTPEDLGLNGSGDQAVLNRFQISVLTEGSGTQLFSTTFVQWSAREALRRAQPLTVLARFTPRQREDSMRELLAGTQHAPVPDPDGSLVDADMGAYYTWINLQRLPGAEEARFLVWFEDHSEALAIGPSFERGAERPQAVSLSELVRNLS